MSEGVRHKRPLSEHVAEEVRALLARRRMSGRELARRLHVSPNWVSLRTTGAQPINMDDLERIADVLDIEPAELLPGRANNPDRYNPGQRVIATVGVDRPTRLRRFAASPVVRPHIPGRAVAQTRPTSRVSL
jgi:transcriptional regulator with XRE-family HTH domain